MNKIYTTQIEFLSRGQLRGGISWSTKRVKEALKEMGYKCEPCISGCPDNTLVQKVVLKGTRDEVLYHRNAITQRLRIMSSGRMAVRFNPGDSNG